MDVNGILQVVKNSQFVFPDKEKEKTNGDRFK